MAGRPPLRQSPPPPRSSWWAEKDVQQSRERFAEVNAVEAERMNAVTSAAHVQRGESDK